MHKYKDLIVWERSVSFVVDIYKIANNFPDKERFNLVSQMQRSATSVASNIAEGAGRDSNAMFKQFLTIALGSAYELETQIIISNKLGYINDKSCNELLKEITEIQRMIFGLHKTL